MVKCVESYCNEEMVRSPLGHLACPKCHKGLWELPIEENKEFRLNLGCGCFPLKGYTNIDLVAGEGVDLVLDVDGNKLPFKNSSINEVCAFHLFEHIIHIEFLLSEVWRVLRPEGFVRLTVPHHSHFIAYHPLINRLFNVTAFDHFLVERQGIKEAMHVRMGARFSLVKRRLVFKHHAPGFWLGFLNWFFNRSLDSHILFEVLFSKWLQCFEVEFVFKAVKG